MLPPSDPVVVPKRTKSFTSSLSSPVEKHTSLPNIFSNVAKLVPKKEPTSAEHGNETSYNKPIPPVDTHRREVADWSGEKESDDAVLNQDVFVPVDLSILNYRFEDFVIILF